MLKLYHGENSVCSQKVRVALAEKSLEWESVLLDLGKGDQFAPAYLALNPDAVVPTLVHDDLVVRESSVIIEYVDRLSPSNPLMPTAVPAEMATRLWLIRAISIHEAINTMSFATVQRQRVLRLAPEAVEAEIARLPNPQVAAKRRDIFANGIESVFVAGALRVLTLVFRDMQSALADGPWLTGDRYALADTTLIAYVDRLDRLGLKGLWEGRFSRVEPWLRASQARPSYNVAIGAFLPAKVNEAMRVAGEAAWPEIARLLV